MFWISCMAAGLSLCGFVWVVTRPVVLQKESAADYSDRWAMRLLWPWVQAFALLCGPFISWRTRARLTAAIRVAGLRPTWRPEHIVAMQLLALLALAPLCAVLAHVQVSPNVLHSVLWGLAAGGAGFCWPRRWLSDAGKLRQRQMLKEFPFLLDLTTLCVEAGLSLQGALQQAATHGPSGPLQIELRHALAEMRAGVSRIDALNELAARTGLPAVNSLVVALAQADQLGMSLGPLLRAQSSQRRAERFQRAERLALEAPVKMLFPMVFCIFPCTFLVIGFPIAVQLTGMGF
jgi:tight adherence protein C